MLYSRSMLVSATIFAHALVGVSALSLSRRPNGTMTLTYEAGDHCEGEGKEQACDIAEQAGGNLLTPEPKRPFFVKFHKVGGTTVMELLNTFMGMNTACGRSCGECLCESEAKACTGHISRVVLQHLVEAASEDPHSFLMGGTDALDAQLIQQEERRQMFKNIDPSTKSGSLPLQWLPQSHAQKTDVVFITLLRIPIERIRSKYYYIKGLSEKRLKNHNESHHMSFMEWMDVMRDDAETCCEYVQGFGVGSLSTSKMVLASLFDVVGFTEEMDDVYVELAKQFGIPKVHLPPSISCRDDSTSKDDWTDEQLSLAKKISADDTELYDFARKLKKKRQQAA